LALSESEAATSQVSVVKPEPQEQVQAETLAIYQYNMQDNGWIARWGVVLVIK